MRSQKTLHTERGGGRSHRAWLYSIVFAGKLSTAAVFVLFLSFMIQPFHLAMANEAASSTDEVVPDEVIEQLPESVAEETEQQTVDVVETEVVAEDAEEEIATESPAEEELLNETETPEDVVVTPETTDETASEVSSGGGSGGSDEELIEVIDEDSIDSVIETNVEEIADETTDVIPVTSKTTSKDDLIDGKVIQDGVASLVDNVVNDVVTLTRQMVNDENYYQFSKQSCVAVGDGTYHCTSKEKSGIDQDSAVYADQDESGDMEIYLRTSKGDIKQLTDNDFDDTSPAMDLATMRVVWQRLIDGRYQIISYDLDKREETQLTFSKNNSMEPKVSKEGIVWQAWDSNDWEIMYFDGKVTDQITDNEVQDVTPVVEDGYVLWSVLGGETSEARVYSIESGETMTISGHEGGTVANPRFVIVYDTKYENGDIVTQGFDPITGLAAPIAAQPTELPLNIPEPDPIGEIKALIQNKSTSKDKEVITVPVSPGDSDLNLATTTSTSTITLDLNAQLDYDNGAAIMPDVGHETAFELGEYDLVITNEASSTTSAINRPYYDNGTTTVNLKIASSTQQ